MQLCLTPGTAAECEWKNQCKQDLMQDMIFQQELTACIPESHGMESCAAAHAHQFFNPLRHLQIKSSSVLACLSMVTCLAPTCPLPQSTRHFQSSVFYSVKIHC